MGNILGYTQLSPSMVCFWIWEVFQSFMICRSRIKRVRPTVLHEHRSAKPCHDNHWSVTGQ